MSSKSVEKRVVEMQFDNQQFEKGVRTTMGTLEKLRQSLKLDGAAKGLFDEERLAQQVYQKLRRGDLAKQVYLTDIYNNTGKMSMKNKK